MGHSLTGTRIREHRRRAGISQTGLARQAGISTSYLNLIEHNKRGIAGKVLLSIARALGVSVAELTESADSAVVGALQEAAAYRTGAAPETETIGEFVGRFPGWAGLLATLYRQARDQEATIAALSDRLAHDPFLAESLHLMLSNITAIRSTNGILASVEDIAPEQRARFHAAIKEESRRLSDAATALVEYFDRSDVQSARSATPEEEVDRFLSRHAYHFPALDAPEASEDDIETLLAEVEAGPARTMVRRMLETYLENARAMPLERFSADAAAAAYDPVALAQSYRQPLHAVFQRLACLKREGSGAPAMGLLIVNAAGQALRRLSLPGFPLPRHGNACPLWPVFRGFTQPGHPVRDIIEMPEGARFLTLTVALPRAQVGFGEAPEYRSAMLVVPLDQAEVSLPWGAGQEARPVGTSCRICPRDDCPSRVEDRI